MPVHVLGSIEPQGRTWRCNRTTGGQKCGHDNPVRAKLCRACGKPRPAKRRPKHMTALDLPYETYVAINGGDHCFICGRAPSPTRRLDRDHDHATGTPRGLLCPTHNRVLWRGATAQELRKAAYYLESVPERLERAA